MASQNVAFSDSSGSVRAREAGVEFRGTPVAAQEWCKPRSGSTPVQPAFSPIFMPVASPVVAGDRAGPRLQRRAKVRVARSSTPRFTPYPDIERGGCRFHAFIVRVDSPDPNDGTFCDATPDSASPMTHMLRFLCAPGGLYDPSGLRERWVDKGPPW